MKCVVILAVFLAVTSAQQDENTLSSFVEEATTSGVNVDNVTPEYFNSSPTETKDSSSSEINSSPQVDGSLELAVNPETEVSSAQGQISETIESSGDVPEVSARQSESEPSSQSSFVEPQKVIDEPEPTTLSLSLSQSDIVVPKEETIEPEPVNKTQPSSEGSEVSQESSVDPDPVAPSYSGSEVLQESSSQPNPEEPTESSVEPDPPSQSQSNSELLQESPVEQKYFSISQSSFELPQEPSVESKNPASNQPNKSDELETVKPSSLKENEPLSVSENASPSETGALEESSINLNSEIAIIEERYNPSSSAQPDTEKPVPSSEIPPVTIAKTEVTNLLPTSRRPPPSFLQRSPFARYLTSRAPPTTPQPTTQAPRLTTTTSRPYTPIVNRISSEDQNAKTLYYENEISPDGSYKYAFETSNGIAAQAEGTPRTYDGEPPYTDIVASGAFSWLYPNGQKIFIKYTADENGYHPEGDSLPTPPPIPDQIARALEWIKKVNEERKSRQLEVSK